MNPSFCLSLIHISSDVDIVLFTHLHWDHVFYLDKFPQARFICNEVEWNYAHNPIPLRYKSYCRPIIAKDGDVTVSYTHLDVYKRQALKHHRIGIIRNFFKPQGIGCGF